MIFSIRALFAQIIFPLEALRLLSGDVLNYSESKERHDPHYLAHD